MGADACELFEEDRGLVLKIGGQLTFDEIEEFDKLTRRVAARKVRRVVLDLSDLRIITSAGIGALLKLRRTLIAQNCTVHLAALRPEIARLMELTGLTKSFQVYPTVAEALS